jgi:hypothetical protein
MNNIVYTQKQLSAVRLYECRLVSRGPNEAEPARCACYNLGLKAGDIREIRRRFEANAGNFRRLIPYIHGQGYAADVA